MKGCKHSPNYSRFLRFSQILRVWIMVSEPGKPFSILNKTQNDWIRTSDDHVVSFWPTDWLYPNQ